MNEIILGEKMLIRILSDTTSHFVRTGSPNIICTRLPHHWRCNKQLPSVFKVVCLCTVPNGTKVSLLAGNVDHHRARLRNAVATTLDNVATFDDLRFVGRSGRGKSFHVVITIHSKPMQVAIYKEAIKITIDGPRMPRNKIKFEKSLSQKSISSTSSPLDNQILSPPNLICDNSPPLISRSNDTDNNNNDNNSQDKRSSSNSTIAEARNNHGLKLDSRIRKFSTCSSSLTDSEVNNNADNPAASSADDTPPPPLLARPPNPNSPPLARQPNPNPNPPPLVRQQPVAQFHDAVFPVWTIAPFEMSSTASEGNPFASACLILPINLSSFGAIMSAAEKPLIGLSPYMRNS